MKIIVRIVVSILILILASASVANIHARAIQLHADGGWQTWGVSVGVAVSFALFSYLLISYKKAFFGWAAAFGAVLTGAAQTGMYLALGADWITALSFGCGGPILEALLAMSEHYMDEPACKKSASNPLWGRLGNALVARIEPQAQPLLQVAPQPLPQPVQEIAPIAQPKLNAAQRRQSLAQRLRDFETPDQINNTLLGEEFDTSRETIRKDLQWLVDNNMIELNGKVKVLI